MIRRLLSAALCVLFVFSPVFAEERVGTTFSAVQCAYLGVDWVNCYRQTLDLGLGIIRLGAYWNEIEKQEGVFDFSRLDWQIARAKEKKIPVLLTVGMKAPRWPEFFIPDWLMQRIYLKFGGDVADNDELAARTLRFVAEVVCHYRSEPAVLYWQVENEPLNRSGEKNWWIDKEFLKKEIELTKRIDSVRKRPVVVNIATYPNGVIRFFATLNIPNDPIGEAIEICDILAVNVYPTVGQRVWGKFNVCLRTSPKRRRAYLGKIVRMAAEKKKPTWSTELQTEPWEPGQLVHVGKEWPVTCVPESFTGFFDDLRAVNIRTILLWGVEYWFYRRVRYGDEGWWKAGEELIRRGKRAISRR
ncbi:MAG: beta-galactosidase [Deltaproteobacteria bacterium]